MFSFKTSLKAMNAGLGKVSGNNYELLTHYSVFTEFPSTKKYDSDM